jgi:hypothetical protein
MGLRLNENTVDRRKRLPHLDVPNVGQALPPANSDVFNGALPRHDNLTFLLHTTKCSATLCS